MTIANETDVLAFLAEFKKLIYSRRFILIGNREINSDTLIILGITESQRHDYIANLTKSDYCEGPNPDDTGDGDVWIFGKEISSKEIYIKLKIKLQPDGKQALCISFHIAKWPLNYKF